MGIYTEAAKAIIKTALFEGDNDLDEAHYILEQGLDDSTKYSELGDEIYSLFDEMMAKRDEERGVGSISWRAY